MFSRYHTLPELTVLIDGHYWTLLPLLAVAWKAPPARQEQEQTRLDHAVPSQSRKFHMHNRTVPIAMRSKHLNMLEQARSVASIIPAPSPCVYSGDTTVFFTTLSHCSDSCMYLGAR